MHPVLLQLDSGPPINTYGVLFTLGICIGLLYCLQRGRRIGLGPDTLFPLFLMAVFGGLIGAKVLYAIGAGSITNLWSLTGGFAYYGGVIGGAIGLFSGALFFKVNPWKLGDLVAPGLLFGYSIGRLGCFFAGCCHGASVLHPHPQHALLPDGLLEGQLYTHPVFPWLSNAFEGGASRILNEALYPTQLWQSLGAASLGALLAWRSNHRRFDGQILALLLLTEPILRIFVELFRADLRGYAIAWTVDTPPAFLPGVAAAGKTLGQAQVGITTSQSIALAMLGIGATLWFLRRNRGVAPEEPLPDPWEDPLED